jgi:hypothetical protein
MSMRPPRLFDSLYLLFNNMDTLPQVKWIQIEREKDFLLEPGSEQSLTTQVSQLDRGNVSHCYFRRTGGRGGKFAVVSPGLAFSTYNQPHLYNLGISRRLVVGDHFVYRQSHRVVFGAAVVIVVVIVVVLP